MSEYLGKSVSPLIILSRKFSLLLMIPILLVATSVQALEVHSRVEGKGLVAQNPLDPQAYIIFSNFLESQGDFKGAQEVLEKGRIKAHPSADLLVKLCEVLEAQELTSQAETAALAALDVDPKHSDANICLGEIYFKMGWQKSALDAFERAVENDPEATRPRVKLLGGLMASGKLVEAENLCHEYLATNSNDVDLWLSLGQILEKMEKRQAAFTTYGQVLTIDPDNSVAYSRQGRLFCEFGQFSAAETSCEKALQLDPDNALAHAYLGIACSYLGDKDRALIHSEKAEKAGMNMTVVYKIIGR
jgi:tetratricopeptide (TPR) repeat protein